MTFHELYVSLGLTIRNGTADPQYILVKGRVRWAFETLMQGASKGVTPITCPGHRWSHHEFKLRKVGVDIERIHESQDGQFLGTHALNVFHSGVTLGGQGGAA